MKEDKLANQLKKTIESGIHRLWLKSSGTAEVKLKRFKHEGQSNAIIFKVKANEKLILKFNYNNIKKEIDGYRILSRLKFLNEHLTHPLFSGLKSTGGSIFLMPYQESKELNELLQDPAKEDYIVDLYDDFLRNMKRLWTTTKSKDKDCDYKKIYYNRITGRLKKMKEALKEKRNIKEITFIGPFKGGKITLEKILKKFHQEVDSLQRGYSCTTHGDEHGRNILIPEEAVNTSLKTGWYIIDYTSVTSNNDWIFSIARMLNWWRLQRSFELKEKSGANESYLKYDKRKRELTLSYNKDYLKNPKPEILGKLENKIMEVAKETGKEFQDSDWEKRLNVALFSLLFGSILLRFSKRGFKKDFTIPVMFDQSLEYLLPTSSS